MDDKKQAFDNITRIKDELSKKVKEQVKLNMPLDKTDWIEGDGILITVNDAKSIVGLIEAFQLRVIYNSILP